MRLLQRTISTATWWCQFCLCLATLLWIFPTALADFLDLLDALTLFLGLRLRLDFLAIFLIFSWADLRNLGFSITWPLLSAMACKTPKSKPIGEPSVCCRVGVHSTVIEAYHFPCLNIIVQVLGIPQSLAFPRILILSKLDRVKKPWWPEESIDQPAPSG